MAKALTIKGIATIKPAATRLEVGDGGCPGLHLVVQPSGAMSWGFRYRSPIDGKPKKFTVGPFESYGLAEARREGEALRQMVGRGVDPGETKKAARAKARDPSRDVGALLDQFIARHETGASGAGKSTRVKASKATTVRAMKQQIEADIRPAWGRRKIDAITRADIAALLDGIVERGATVHANRVFSLVRAWLNWCVDRQVLESSPAAGMSKPADEAARTRVLSDDELRWLWIATGKAGAFGACVRLLLLTGQRRMEVGGMMRGEVEHTSNQTLWVIPASRTKNGREHAVPLTATAVAALTGVPQVGISDLVFTTDGKVISSGWSKSKRSLDALVLATAAEEAGEQGRDAPTISPWSLHDLRRTCASRLAKLRQPPHVIEAVLNHKTGQVSGIASVYNTYEYLDEKAAALEVWERFLLGLCEGSASNLISLRQAQR